MLILYQIAEAERMQVRRGFLRLMRGTANRGYLLIGDLGFDFPLPQALVAQGIYMLCYVEMIWSDIYLHVAWCKMSAVGYSV